MKDEKYVIKKFCDIKPRLMCSNEKYVVLAKERGVLVYGEDGEVICELAQRGVREIFVWKEKVYCRLGKKSILIIDLKKRTFFIKTLFNKFRWIFVNEDGVFLVGSHCVYLLMEQLSVLKIAHINDRIICVNKSQNKASRHGLIVGTSFGFSILNKKNFYANSVEIIKLKTSNEFDQVQSICLRHDFNLFIGTTIGMIVFDIKRASFKMNCAL